jgi:uncharacterized protein
MPARCSGFVNWRPPESLSSKFEWDGDKARKNAIKHGVNFVEAATVFYDVLAITISDPAHSEDEPRFVTIGQSLGGRVLVVVHTGR